MWSYIARRAVQALFTLMIITVLCFLLTRFSGDPIAQYAANPRMSAEDKAALRERLGLNQPLPVQYLKWLGLAIQGDLGQSFFSKQPVSEMIAQRLPNTLILMVTTEIVTIALALVLGILSSVRQYSTADNIITSFSFIGYSIPIFFSALGLMLIFAVQFKEWGLPYLPTGAAVWDKKDPVVYIQNLILPVSALVIVQTAGYARFVRTSMLEVLGLDYVRTARAKGLTSKVVLYKHALRNAALPLVTLVGLDIPFYWAAQLSLNRSTPGLAWDVCSGNMPSVATTL